MPARPTHPPGPANYNRWIGLTWRHVYGLRADAVGFSSQVGHEYGDLSSFLLFTRRAYIVNHPDLIHELLVRKRDDFARCDWQMRVLRPVLGDGLITSDGDLWLRQRRLLQQSFRADAMPRQAELAVRVTGEHLARWPDNGHVDLVSDMAALSMTLSIRSTVGLNPHSHDGPTPADLADAVVEGAHLLLGDMEHPLAPPDWAPLPSRRRKRQLIATIDHYIRSAIAIRRQNPGEYNDLLALLLAAVDHEGDGRGMSDRLARDEAVTILLASNHASSAMLGWIWKLVLARPAVHERLVEEVDRVLAGRPATAADLPRFAYTKQVIQEALRLYPAAWVLFGREAVRETTLGGYRIRRGGWLFLYPFVTQRDPRFFAEPLTFDPERFAPERIGDIPSGAYFPFGHGPRNCIGQHLAMLQLTLIVATVLQRYRLTPTPGCDDMAIFRDFSIRPATPCVAEVSRCKAMTEGDVAPAVSAGSALRTTARAGR